MNRTPPTKAEQAEIDQELELDLEEQDPADASPEETCGIDELEGDDDGICED